MATLQGVGEKFKYMSRKIDGQTHRLLREVVRSVVTELVYATPVDTGRARSSWRTGIGRQRVGVPYKEPLAPPSPEEGAQRSIDEMEAALSYNTVGGKTVYITSNLSYMDDLNTGTSAQAGAGFVERAVLRGRNKVRDLSREFWKVL